MAGSIQSPRLTLGRDLFPGLYGIIPEFSDQFNLVAVQLSLD